MWTRPAPPWLTIDGQLDVNAENDHYQNQELAMSCHRSPPTEMPARTPLTGISLLAHIKREKPVGEREPRCRRGHS